MVTPRKDPKDYLKLGRPTDYTPELADLICERIASNPVGLDTIIAMYEDMPGSSTIYKWHAKFPEFREKYLAAKAIQAVLRVQEIDDMLPHEILYIIDDKGNKRIDPPSASLAIAKCNNRKWEVARLAPRYYPDRTQESAENNTTHDEAMKNKVSLEEEHKKEY